MKLALKAPNDICVDDRKLGGILVEATTEAGEHFLHVGLGLNVFAHPLQHSQTATNLYANLGTILTPEAWTQFIENFGTGLANIEKRAGAKADVWLKKIEPRLVGALNRHPTYKENPIKGVAGDGSLTLERGTITWQNI